MRLKLHILIFFIVSGAFLSHAQNISQRLAIGQWASQFPYRNGLSVAQSEGLVYYSTPLGLMVFDKSDYSYTSYEKEEGLPYLGAGAMTYIPDLDMLAIGYKNGLITTFKEGSFVNFTDIRDYQNPIDKQINHLNKKQSTSLLISANYGLTELDLAENKFVFTTFTEGVPVYGAVYFDDKYYIGTSKGLYLFDPSSGNIIQDFGKWISLLPQLGLQKDLAVTGVGVIGQTLYFGANHSIYKIENGKATEVLRRDEYQVSSLKESKEALLAAFQCTGNCSKGAAYKILPDDIIEVNQSCIGVPLEGIIDQNDRIWMADMYDGFRVMLPGSGDCKYLFPNSPYTKDATDFAFDKSGRVLVPAGNHSEVWSPLWIKNGFYRYDGKTWEQINYKHLPVLKDSLLYDIYKIVVHPQTGNYFIASYLSGLIEMTPEGDIVHIWNKNNSALQGTVGDEARTRISALAFDKDNNLWICNYGAAKPLVKYAADGSWSTFGNQSAGSEYANLDIDENGNVWIAVPGVDVSRGVVVFNEGDPNTEGDEQWRVFTQSNSVLPSNSVNDIQVDLDGSVWACTSLGVVTFDCSSDAFDTDRCSGDRRKVLVNGIPEYLLNYEIVHSVSVDGANRKWFGTESGVYVMSPSGEELIANYNEKNSPLPDNKVEVVRIEPKTGLVYIGTSKGVVSLRTDATEGPKSFLNAIEVFPNPVRPEYTGQISIRGLARDARVKITDIDGQLVYETKANGGLATWDGKDFNGNDVSSGVYYIFATRFEEFSVPESAMGKVVIVR